MYIDRKMKIGRIGERRVEVRVYMDNGRVSLTGEIGSDVGGQIDGWLKDVDTFEPGWDRESVDKLAMMWDRWHLNDMRAGSPAQEEFLRGKNLDYVMACKALGEAGLNPDPNFKLGENDYRYGSAWIMEGLPSDVVEYFEGLGK